MVYEINLKLRFIPDDRKTSNRTSVRRKKYTGRRHKDQKRSTPIGFNVKETQKEKPNKTKSR